MGGMILYMYLQGASFRDGAFHADPDLAVQRNAAIAAGVTIASPADFRWPKGAPYGRIMSSRPLRMATGRLIKMLHGLPEGRQKLSVMRHLGIVVHLLPRMSRALACNPAMFVFYNPRNVDADVVTVMAERILDNLSAGMTIQLLQDVLEGTCKDFRREYDYSCNMGRITAPMLFIAGDRDFVNAQQVRLSGYEGVGSVAKQFTCFAGYGHTDLVMGKRVEHEVYPVIGDWLQSVLG
jgi:hypothetical protein